MKKNYFLWVLLIFFGTTITALAQSYSLKDLTEEQFASGGTDQWSFEQHDVNAGVYSTFTTYANTSTAVNYYDQFLTERFCFYPIMNRPTSGTQYDVKRNAWFTDANEYLYVAAEYPSGTLVGDNLTYGVNYPDSLCGYEVYSISNGKNSAITFTVPEDGYYKADMKVIRQDLWNNIGEMKVYQFFRYGGQGTVFPMGKEFSYGKTQGIDPWGAGNDAIYTANLAKIPEYPTVNGNSGKPYRGLPTYSTSNYFYFNAHAGDKISFEADARSTGNPESSVRGAYARTKWINLVVSKTDQATATSEGTKFVDPYVQSQSLVDSLISTLEAAQVVIGNSAYSLESRSALEVIFTNIDYRVAAEAVLSMEIPTLIDQLRRAMAICIASEGGLKVRYTFDNVTNGIVPDLSGQGNVGTLVNNASIIRLGKFNVMDLGSANGYLDMGANVGAVISNMSSFTISAYYRVDPLVTLSGNGLFLWTFATQTTGGSTSGQYIYYQLQNQRLAITKTAGWNSEQAVTLATAATKGEWQHVVYTQEGADGKLFINGSLVKENTEMPIPSATFTQPTPYNWIGRPGFNDPYLKNTLVYDVRLYNYAMSVDSITNWNGVVAELETASNEGSNGDYTVLDSLATSYSNLIDTYVIGETAGKYPQAAKDAFSAAIASAKALSVANASSQIKINSEVEVLKTAYKTFLAALIVETNTLAEGNYYITLTDSLYLTNRGATLIANGSNLTIANGGLSTIKITTDASQVFTLAKVTSLDPPRFSIFSALNEGGTAPYRHITETSVIQNNWGAPGGGVASGDDDWRTFNILKNGTSYAIACAGKGLTNSKKGYLYYDTANKKLSASASGSAAAYEFNFISISTGINDIVKSGVRIIAATNAIRVSTEESAIVSVYTMTGSLIAKAVVAGTQSINVPSGLYIVKVVGKASIVNKVMVK